MKKANTGGIMIRSKIREKQQEPIIVLPKHQEDIEDLSWMIQDEHAIKQQPVKNKKTRRKKS